MPRNIAGVYTLPLPPVNPGDVVESAWANTTLEDIALAISESLDRLGRGGMLAPFALADGTEAAPGLAFEAQPGTGFWRSAPGIIGVSVTGNNVASFGANGLDVEGALAAFSADGRLSLRTEPGQAIIESVDNGVDPVLPLHVQVGGVNTLILDEANNLGFRVDPYPWGVGNPAFDFSGIGGIESDNFGTNYVGNVYYDGTDWRFKTNGSGVAVGLNVSGALQVNNTAAAGTAGAVASMVNRWYLHPEGYTDINAPSAPWTFYTLMVTGNNANNGVSGSGAMALRVLGSFGGGIGMEDGAATWAQWMASGKMYQGVSSGGGAGAITRMLRWNLDGGQPRLTIENLGVTGAGLWFDGSATAERFFLGVEAGTDTGFRLYSASGGTNVYQYSSATGQTTFAAGQVNAPAFNATSRRELKEHIRRVKRGALARVMTWDLYEYDYVKGPKRQIGPMAGEIDARIADDESVNLKNAVFELAAAVQELSRRVH